MANSLAIDHRDPRITYSGQWVQQPDAHWTTEQNATATFHLGRQPEGSALVSVTGTIAMVDALDPSSRLLRYTLDGQEDRSFNPFDTETTHILYSSPALPQGQHTLSLTLLTNASILSVEGMFITYTASAGEALPRMLLNKQQTVAIVGAAVAVVMLLAILWLALFISNRRRENTVLLNSMGPLRVALPTTKEAFTSPNSSTYGLSFHPYIPEPRDNLTPLPPRISRPRLKRHKHPTRLPPRRMQVVI
ncbi:hypothetical protein AX17_002644 [Amanita inopinata Kibby_2008]|nr:hypothetical protein AX17_002644 [Amanita inopinata Kibby_2008]